MLATGEEFVTVNADGIPEINTSERLYNVVNAAYPVAHERYYTNAAANKAASLSDFFINAQALFFQTSLGTALSMRDMKSDFGIIPAPKSDESQERYYCPLAASTASMLLVPSWNDDLERTGYITDAMGYYSMKLILPAFYEYTIEAKTIRDDDSLKTVELMVNSKFYVLNDIFNFGKSNNVASALVTGTTNNFASLYASYQSAMQTSINEYLESII